MAHSAAFYSSSADSDFDSIIDSDFGTYRSANSFAALDDPYAPQWTLHDFRRFQRSPAQSPSPRYDHKRVRRKPSLANLTGREPQAYPLTPAAWSARSHKATHVEIPLSNPSPPSLLPPFEPSPHIQLSKLSSSTLSSSTDAASSTVTRFPTQRATSRLQRWTDEDSGVLPEHISSKRKFSSFKQAKRLPRFGDEHGGGMNVGTGGAGLWRVHAAIIHPPHEPGKLCEAFTGSGTAPQSGRPHPASTTSSSFRTQRPLQFSPGYERTKPELRTSPATFLYQGASFDVVNPHTSFLLGANDFETPADIDGLLDHYFDGLTDTAPPGDGLPTDRESQRSQISPTARRRVLPASPPGGNPPLSLPPAPPPLMPRRASGRRNRFSERGYALGCRVDQGEVGDTYVGAAVPDPSTPDSITRAYEAPAVSDTAGTVAPMESSRASIERGRGVDGLTGTVTYGETSDLLRVTPEPTLGEVSSRPVVVRPGDAGHQEVCPAIQPGTSTESPPIPRMWEDADRPALTPAEIQGAMRGSSAYPDDEHLEWVTTRSNSRRTIRPSEESYADTSLFASEHRLEQWPLPVRRPTGPNPESPRQAMIPHPSDAFRNEIWRTTALALGSETDDAEKTRRAIDCLNNEAITGGLQDAVPGGRRLTQSERQANLATIDAIRQTDPSAFRRATEIIAQGSPRASFLPHDNRAEGSLHRSPASEYDHRLSTRLSNMLKPSPSPRKKYSPSDSFTKITETVPASSESHASAEGSARTVQRRPTSSEIIGGLPFNDSTNTFGTYPVGRSRAVRATSPWDPTQNAAQTLGGVGRPPGVARPRGFRTLLPKFGTRATGLPGTLGSVETGQYELQNIRTARTYRARTIRRSRMTDDELAEREPHWVEEPNLQNDGPLSRHAVRTPIDHLDFRNMRMLQNPTEYHNAERIGEQDRISKRYLNGVTLFPFLLLPFGFGGLDFLMRWHTRGRITAMSESAKNKALIQRFPLVFLVYLMGIIGIIIWIKTK